MNETSYREHYGLTDSLLKPISVISQPHDCIVCVPVPLSQLIFLLIHKIVKTYDMITHTYNWKEKYHFSENISMSICKQYRIS